MDSDDSDEDSEEDSKEDMVPPTKQQPKNGTYMYMYNHHTGVFTCSN